MLSLAITAFEIVMSGTPFSRLQFLRAKFVVVFTGVYDVVVKVVGVVERAGV